MTTISQCYVTNNEPIVTNGELIMSNGQNDNEEYDQDYVDEFNEAVDKGETDLNLEEYDEQCRIRDYG